MQPDALCQALRSRFVEAEAADKMPRGFFGLSSFLMCGAVAHFDQLASFWKIRRLGIGGNGAQFAPFAASVPGGTADPMMFFEEL